MQAKDLVQLAEQFGSPLYVYDAAKIQSQYKRLTSAFSKVEKLRINYAMKALSNVAILQLLREMGSCIDAVSIQEVQLALHAGYSPDQIFFTPNGVSLEEIEEVSALGVQINIDNLSILEQFGTKHPSVPVCIRINPHVMAGGNANISVGHIDSKFGISVHQLPRLVRIVENTKMKIAGIHMHTGSDILDIEVFLYAAEFFLMLPETSRILNFLTLEADSEFLTKKTMLKPISKNWVENYPKDSMLSAKKTKDLTLIFEPGKFLVSEAGYFLAKVNVVKQTTSTVFAGIDSGFNHLIRPMFYGSQHHIENISNPKGKERFYSVVGYICETDTFANNRRISEINEGDVLSFRNAGAYCFSMSSNYNSRYKPAEVLWLNGEGHLIRAQETFEDLLKNQIPLPAIATV